jgi:2'-5' RNA ligase
MYAVVSLLDEHHYTRLESLWRELESDCSLAGITLTPLPHFSWHIAAEYDFKQLEAALDELAARVKPFRVRTSGLGIFTGQSPVIFIPVLKDFTLAGVHHRIWEQAQPVAIGASPHYATDAWVPHISLAYGDVDPKKLGCAMEKLAFQPYNWEIQVDNLALVYTISGQIGKLQRKFPFGG